MRSLLFSRSNSMILFCSGVLLSAACGEPVALMGLIRLRSVVLPRSCSRMISLGGFPALQGDTIRLLNSSVKCLGCFGSAIRASFRRPS